jgi:hypothetical protein
LAPGRGPTRLMARQPSPRRRRLCPEHGVELLPVVYGMPAGEAMMAAERGELLLAGCMVWPGAPRFGCPICGIEPPESLAGGFHGPI